MTNLQKLIDSLTQNPNDITFGGVAHVMQVIIDIYANAGKAGEVIRHYHAAIGSVLSMFKPMEDKSGIYGAVVEFCENVQREAEKIAGETL